RHTRWPRDWSSDVCSPDLKNLALRDALRPIARRHGRAMATGDGPERVPQREVLAEVGLLELARAPPPVIRGKLRHPLHREAVREIGRASCREREDIWWCST